MSPIEAERVRELRDRARERRSGSDARGKKSRTGDERRADAIVLVEAGHVHSLVARLKISDVRVCVGVEGGRSREGRRDWKLSSRPRAEVGVILTNVR